MQAAWCQPTAVDCRQDSLPESALKTVSMSEDSAEGNPLVELAMFAGSFVGLAIVCDDHMVVALETLCVRWNVSPVSM